MRVTNGFPTWHSNSMRTKDKAAPEVSLVFAHPVHGAPLEPAASSLSPKSSKEHRQVKRRRTSEPTAHVNGDIPTEELEDIKITSAAETSHSPEEQSTSQDIGDGRVEIENTLSEDAANLPSKTAPPSLDENEGELPVITENTTERIELPLSDAQGQNVTAEKQYLKTEPVGEDKHTLLTSSSWFFFGRKLAQPAQPPTEADIVVSELAQEEVTSQALSADPGPSGLVPFESTAIKEQPTRSHLVSSKDVQLSTTPQSSPPHSSWFGPLMNYLSRDNSVIQADKPTEAVVTHLFSSDAEAHESIPVPQNENYESTRNVAADIPPISFSSSATAGQGPRRPEGVSRTDTSVDDEVPKLSSIGTLQGLPRTLLLNNSSNARLNTGLPVVGKPKSPLQGVVSENLEEQIIKDAAFETKPSVSIEVTNINTETENHKVSSTANGGISETKVAQSSYSTSWWSVLGLGTNNESGSQENHVNVKFPTSTIADTNSKSPFVSGDSLSVSSPDITSSSESKPSAAIKTQTTITTVTTLYNPWSWWSAQPPSSTENPPSANENISKTEAEIVKETALVRKDTSAPESTVRSETSNPVTSTFSTNSKGWISFLSSRTALIKSTPGNDDDGMEVMNIDEDDAPSSDNKGVSQRSKETENNSLVLAKQDESRIGDARIKERGRGDSATLPPTTSENVKNRVLESKRSSSVSSSKKSVANPTVRPPNLVLPTFDDTFKTPPRSVIPQKPRTSKSAIKKTLGYMADVFFARDQEQTSAKGKERDMQEFGQNLPRSLELLGRLPEHYLPSGGKVVIIGVHGWFPGVAMRTVIGEPTGTSTKFANMMYYAVKGFAGEQGIEFEKITKIPLEGEGIIEQRVQKLYDSLTSNQEWMSALHEADVLFFVAHSQGTIVSTHLIHKLIIDKHIRMGGEKGSNSSLDHKSGQRVCCLALCGIHLGPLAYLHKSSLVQPYIQYFESAAASELFQFQDTESQVSKDYIKALRFVLNQGVKFVYVASLNDQVVPIYSGACTCANHPLILRALYIDGDAYHSSDFLSNLIVLLFRILNAGLSDAGLLSHLSEATAGSLNGVGHSTVYEELSTYTLAVKYLFLVNNGADNLPELEFEPFDARSTLNDYEIPWCLRDLIADERVERLFSKEFAELRDSFDEWQPKTSILRDLKRKLEPIRRLKLISRL